MVCSRCGAQNRSGRKFCTNCGAALSAPCSACGASNEPEDQYCGECGASLASEIQPAEGAVRSERRLVSVMFTDLVGFTPLSESRDAEDVRALLSRYFDEARRIVGRYGGVVEKFIGDAVMAVWGSPVAREDDAERAVRAALDLVAAVAAIGADDGIGELAARGGVATGEAAVDRGAEHEGSVIGDLVNTASRVQSAAGPGEVYVTEATRRATDASVAYEDTGDHQLKGKREPARLFRALRIVAGRGGVLRAAGLEPPFVGRDRELRIVKEAFHGTVEEHAGHLMSITGIGGIGKSRVAWELEKYIDGLLEVVYWHRGRCIPYGDGVTYWALAEMIRGRIGAVEEEPSTDTQRSLETWLRAWCPDEEERRWLEARVGQLLGFGEGEISRRELVSAWCRFFEVMAEQAPVVLVFEDLQWADAGLFDFVEELLARCQDRAVLVLALARPEVAEKRIGWSAARPGGTSIALGPLRDTDVDALLTGMVPGLPDPLVARIRDRADGVPLYAVETVRMLLDRGMIRRTDGIFELTDANLPRDLDVPETLQALVGARLDNLPDPERRLLQHASVLGKTFSPDALRSVSGVEGDALDELVASLRAKELLTTVADPAAPDRGQLSFLQSIVQRVVYETLSRHDRKARHLAMARYLEASWAGQDEDVAELIAAHYVEAYESGTNDGDAGEIRAQAAIALERAGRRALSLAATSEAEAYFDRAAALAEDDGARVALEEQAAMAVHISGRLEEAIERFDRVIAAYERLGDLTAAARVRAAVGEDLWLLDRLDEALERMEDAYAALQDRDDADVAALAGQLGRMRYFRAEGTAALSAALLPLERALEISERLRLAEVLSDALNTKGLVIGSLERPEESSALLQRALDVALEGDATHATLRAYTNLSNEMMQADRLDAALAYQEAGRALGERTGYLGAAWFLTSHTTVLHAWAGRWELAEELWRRYDAVRDDPAAQQAVTADYSWLLVAGRGRGDAEAARAITDRVRRFEGSGDFQLRAYVDVCLALGAAVHGRSDEALERSLRIVDQHEALGVRHWMFKTAVRDALEAATALRGLAEADRILRQVDAIPPGGRTPTLDATIDRFRAILLAAGGDANDRPRVEELFRSAEDAMRESGFRFELARILLDHAEWRGAAALGSVEPAAQEAIDIFRELQATPWLKRAASLIASPAPV